jgi:hypothetical protein
MSGVALLGTAVAGFVPAASAASSTVLPVSRSAPVTSLPTGSQGTGDERLKWPALGAAAATAARFSTTGSSSPAANGGQATGSRPAAVRWIGPRDRHVPLNGLARKGSSCTHAGYCLINWAGWYVGTGSGNGFQGVKGNWNAPCVGGSPDSGKYSSWVGLGGRFGTESLEQTGIDEQPDGTYRMFWEYVYSDPTSPYGASGIERDDMTDVIHCGQHISASVEYGSRSGHCPSGEWHPHVTDTSTGKTWDPGCMSESHGFGVQSAEWIDERPSVDQSICPPSDPYTSLTDFQWTAWSSLLAQANYSGAGYVAPSSFANSRIVMHDDGTNTDISYPDQTSIGSSFTGRWHAFGTYCDS